MSSDLAVKGGSGIFGGPISITGAVQTLPDIVGNRPLINVWLQAASSNAAPVYIIATYTNTVVAEVVAGDMFSADLVSSDLLRFQGTGGDVIYYGGVGI
jgi:hypothetical protein